MVILFETAIYLEPLNLFLYTWRFWDTLETEDSSDKVSCFYRWFSRTTIFVVPACFYAIYAAFVIEYNKEEIYFYKGEIKKSNLHKDKALALMIAIGYITILCNLLSCLVMLLVLTPSSQI